MIGKAKVLHQKLKIISFKLYAWELGTLQIDFESPKKLISVNGSYVCASEILSCINDTITNKNNQNSI